MVDSDWMPKLLAIGGFGCLAVVVATHIAERRHLFPSMGWGSPNSPGHYLDLASAMAGPTLLLVAFIWGRISN